MNLNGSISKISARTTTSGDVVQIITIEVHGEFNGLRDLMQKPLEISFTVLGDQINI